MKRARRCHSNIHDRLHKLCDLCADHSGIRRGLVVGNGGSVLPINNDHVHVFLKGTMSHVKYLSQFMTLWYLIHGRPAKAQASLRIRAVSPKPSLFAHMKYGNRRRVQPKIRHLVPTGWMRMRVWRMSLRRTKNAIISWAGSFRVLVPHRHVRLLVIAALNYLKASLLDKGV